MPYGDKKSYSFFKMKSSPAKQLWPWGKRTITKKPDSPDSRSGTKIVDVQYPSGETKKHKEIVYGEYGQKMSKTVTKYTKGGKVKKQRTKKYSQKRWE